MRDVAHVGLLGLDEVVLGSVKRRGVIIQRILASACENDISVVRNNGGVTTPLSKEQQFRECGGGGRSKDENGIAHQEYDLPVPLSLHTSSFCLIYTL